MEIVLTFKEPHHAIEIEDALEPFTYDCRIIHTPVELLDVDVYFCKTSILVNNADQTLFERISKAPVAGSFYYNNGRYELAQTWRKGA